MDSSLKNNKSCKIYFIVDDVKVYFNADFDSGNVQKVEQLSPYMFKITPGFDKNRNSSNKTFFHFKVYGLKMCTANFIVTRVNMIQKLIKTNQKDEVPPYYPVYRKANDKFRRVTRQVKKYYNCYDEPQLSFSFQFDKQPFVEFAFSYPYSYEDCQNLIQSLSTKFANHSSIYFHRQVLCLSQQKRNVNLLTITDKQNCGKQRQQNIQNLFPDSTQRPFKVNKPVIFMTARVHPGQSPSSYSIQGAIRFLLNQRDCRSYLLRKNFLIKIIPMINPDGVFYGMFRTDLNGQNLNRVYSQCTMNKHPTIWGIQRYATWLKQNKNVLFFFDFHAHPSTKNFFIYGNSFSQISMQTQAQLFGKMLQFNCPYFQNFESIYSQKQMKIKHKNDNYSKQGCARVFMHRLFNIIHSYTVECGYFGSTLLNEIQNQQGQQIYNTVPFIEDDEFQRISLKGYEPQSYMLMGKSILITILDLFKLNPYPKRIKGQITGQLDLRKSCGTKIYHEIQTYKMTDGNCYKKLNELSSIIEELYYNEKLKGTNLKLGSNQNNNLLQQQLAYLNASPRAKQLMKKSKKNKNMLKSNMKNDKKQLMRSLTKIQNSKQRNQPTSKTPLPYLINQGNQTHSMKQIPKYMGSKVKTLKFLYSDLQRFNQNQTQEGESKFYPVSQKIIQTQSMLYSKNNIFHNNNANFSNIVNPNQLPQMKAPSNKTYSTTLQPKQFIPETRQSKIKSTLQKSITLRKGSLSKIVLIKKDDLKFLRIANLIQKKIQRQAIHGSMKKLVTKDTYNSKQKNNLPMINCRKKQ